MLKRRTALVICLRKETVGAAKKAISDYLKADIARCILFTLVIGLPIA